MRSDPTTAARARRLLTVAGVSMLALALTSPVRAQDDADLDLKPADFMPDEPVAIRVDSLQPGDNGSNVSVTIANRTDHAVTGRVECSLFDADREDLGMAAATTPAVEPGGQVAVTVTAPVEGAKRAYCQIKP